MSIDTSTKIVGGSARPTSISERADELEEQMMNTLERVPSKSPLYDMGDIDPRLGMVRHLFHDPERPDGTTWPQVDRARAGIQDGCRRARRKLVARIERRPTPFVLD